MGAKRPASGLRNTDTKKILLSKAKFAQKQYFFGAAIFTPFISKSFQIWDHFFSLLFPKDSESLKILDIQFQKVGAKRRLNGEQTHRPHTHNGQINLLKALKTDQYNNEV